MHSAVVGAERIDHGTMRTINLALLLGVLRSGPISRAELSRRTHLSKASITSLAAELAARGLVREGSPDRNGTVGRPGTMLTLEGARVCGVGLEINAEYLAVCVVDLCGTVLYDRAQPFDVASLPISDVLDEVAGIMRDTLEQLHSARRHVAQVMVSAPGVIKQPAGTVHLASNLGWRDVPLRSQLLQRLDADISLQVENDAKLAAVAEYRRYEDSDVRDLVYLSGDIGVGAGIIAAGQLMRGWSGFSGEVGHLHLDPRNLPCHCGRTGCWEARVGLPEFLAHTGDRLGAQPIDRLLTQIQDRATRGDQQVLNALDDLATSLAEGLSVVIDMLNPRVVVLGGYFSWFTDFLIPPIAADLTARRLDPGAGALLAGAQLGMVSSAHGAALTALDSVFVNPLSVPQC